MKLLTILTVRYLTVTLYSFVYLFVFVLFVCSEFLWIYLGVVGGGWGLGVGGLRVVVRGGSLEGLGWLQSYGNM